ncbi:MAG TPA: sulfite exporter TauE/SafE family protein [Chloroflexota bacterium]
MDVTRLFAIDHFTLALLIAAVFLAGCLSGSTGIGFANITSVALALLLDARAAVILLSGITPVVMLMPVIRYRDEVGVVRRLLPMFLLTPVGVLIGSYLLVSLPGPAIALGLGLVTIVSALLSLRRGALVLPPAWERRASPVLGLVCGAANASVGVSGPILAMYLLALELPKAAFAFTAAAMFASMGVLRLITLVGMGQITAATVGLSLALCVPAAAGIRAGFWLQNHLDQKLFNRLVLGILLLTGVQLVQRGLTGLGR